MTFSVITNERTIFTFAFNKSLEWFYNSIKKDSSFRAANGTDEFSLIPGRYF